MLCRGHDETADEIAQEAFLKAWNSIESFEGQSQFSTWLFQIARNTLWDLKKKRGLDEQAFLDNQGEIISANLGERMDLYKALESIPSDERDVLILSYVEGFSHSEIGKLTASPVGTVKSRILQAKAKLTQFFQGEPA